MLNPNNDRLDYGQILSAPNKYKLDFAIGTTYSLDLDALVGASLALGLSEDTDSKLVHNPIALLEALRVTGDKIALFCEAGQIHMPSKVTSLYILLEQMVYQVKTPKTKGIGTYPSFHPKFWLIRYIDEKNNPLYRVVILSRNLTFDRSWDVTFCMDGVKKDTETTKNDPIKDFLAYTLPFAKKNPDKQKKIRQICKELSYIHFDVGSNGFYDFDFIPVGVRKADGGYYSIKDYPLFTSTFNELLVMSPFLSDEVIKGFNDSNRSLTQTERVLITRAMSLSSLKPENCDKFRIYTVKDSVIDGESIVSEEDNNIQKQDIHAKIFMLRKYSDSELYLGSLNASRNAIIGNIEFVIRLKAKNRHLNLTKLTESLFCGAEDNPNNPFQLVDVTKVPKSETEPEQLLSAIVKDITRLKATATVTPNGDNYNVQVVFDKLVSGYDITISPLFSNKQARLDTQVEFVDLTAVQLSEFYKITVSDGTNSLTRVIMIPTTGLPEEREKMIVSSVVKDKNCFYQYVSFLLGDSLSLGGAEIFEDPTSSSSTAKHHTTILPALYEKMLKTAVEEPEKFKEIDYLLKAVAGDDVIPAKFEETYRIFRKAVGYRD